MVDAQKWLNLNKEYSEIGWRVFGNNISKSKIKEIRIGWNGLENSLSLREFINLEELSIQNDGIQDYFSNPPRINRNKITSLDLLENKKLKELLCGNNRIGTLDLRNNKKIITIDCSGNELKNLDLSSCFYLEELNLRNNQLSSIDFLDSLPNSEKLNYLNISNNNFKAQDLSFLSKLTNLKKLFIGGNKFYGSLFFLKEINNLKELDISDTDIESGIEYLPENLEKIYCKIEKKGGGVGCFHIKNSLEKYCKEKDELYDFSSWKIKPWRSITEEKKSKDNSDSLITKSSSLNSPQFTTISSPQSNFNSHCSGELSSINNSAQIKKTTRPENIVANQNNKIFQLKNTQIKPTLNKKIGLGGFANVYQGTWNNQQVAIKKSKHSVDSISEKEMKSIGDEINLLKNLRNRYIIQYYSLFKDEQELMIIMELADHGSLDKFIKSNQSQPHNWEQNYNFIKNITNGLNYLHCSNIIHRDLKSMNILITEGMIAKISDFGLSKIINELNSIQSSSKGLIGTPRWMAPEIVKERKKDKKPYSIYSDIYSLGMIMWEIASKRTMPFKDYKSNIDVINALNNGEKEVIPNDVPNRLKQVIQSCWDDDPQERISLKNVLEKLENNNNNNSYLAQTEASNNTY